MRSSVRRGGLAVVAALAVVLAARGDADLRVVPSGAVVAAPAVDVAAPRPPLRIMPLGASSTVGAGSLDTGGYRGPLQDLLARDRIAVDFVGSLQGGSPAVPDRDHEGHGGWSMAQMQPLVAGWVRRQRPDVVLLHVGTNDLLQGVSAAVTAQRLATLLDSIHEAWGSAHVVVAGVWAPLADRAAARAQYARLAAGVVLEQRALGRSATFVDTSALLGPGDFTDALHADLRGYRKIAGMWEAEIQRYLRSRH
jgi:acyl-CoA thioesterase I